MLTGAVLFLFIISLVLFQPEDSELRELYKKISNEIDVWLIAILFLLPGVIIEGIGLAIQGKLWSSLKKDKTNSASFNLVICILCVCGFIVFLLVSSIFIFDPADDPDRDYEIWEIVLIALFMALSCLYGAFKSFGEIRKSYKVQEGNAR